MGDWRVERVRASYAAFAAVDADAFVALYDAACIWDFGPMAAAFPQRYWRGVQGLRDLIREFGTTLADFEPTIVALRRDGERVLVRAAARLDLARPSALVVEGVFGQLVEFRDGRILHVTVTEDPPPGWEGATPVAEPADGVG